MKVNSIVKSGFQQPKAPVRRQSVVESAREDGVQPSPHHVDSVIFPASERFKHMLSLIARDDKELYNRIVGLE